MTIRQNSWDLSVPVNTQAGPGWVGSRATLDARGGNSVPSFSKTENRYERFSSYKTSSVMKYNYPPSSSFYTCTAWNAGFVPFWRDTWGPNDELALLAKVIGKIKGHAFNLAVALAEGGQTLDMIGSAAKRIDTALMYASRKDMRRAARALRARRPRRIHEDFASNWLELQYGWLPLLNDVYEGAQALAETFSKRYVQSYKARTEKEWSRSGSDVQRRMNFAYADKRSFHQLIVRFSTDLSTAANLGLFEPEKVLWEKVPYSFVIDWFSPIGTWLEVMGVLRTLQFYTYVRTTYTVEDWGTPLTSKDYSVVDGGGNSGQAVTVSRKVGYQLAVPLPETRPISEAMSWKRCANSVALLAQRRIKLPSAITKHYTK